MDIFEILIWGANMNFVGGICILFQLSAQIKSYIVQGIVAKAGNVVCRQAMWGNNACSRVSNIFLRNDSFKEIYSSKSSELLMDDKGGHRQLVHAQNKNHVCLEHVAVLLF